MIDQQKWQQFSFAQQMGHVASEISRAKHWEEKNDATSLNNALKRALELVELTAGDTRWSDVNKEIVRLQKGILELLNNKSDSKISLADLEARCFSLMPQ